jgi:hypothetical protein
MTDAGRRSVPGGLRISRVPGKPVQRDPDGRYAIHLWLRHEGRFDGDVVLQLSPLETELLHAQLCYALDEEPVATLPDATPECRRDARTSGSRVRWP